METLTDTKNRTIAEEIEARQQKYLEEKIHRGRWKSIRASGIGDKCVRRIYYYLTVGELADDITTELAAIFAEGNDQEPGVRRLMSELGMEVMKAGTNMNWDEYNISGTIDGTLVWEGNKYLVEIKTVSDFAWDKLNKIEDFDEGYYQKWAAQMQIYLLLFGYEKGIFVLKKKSAKKIKIIEASLNYDYAESLLAKAETVNQAVKTMTPPDFLQCNPVECKKCPFFGKVCNPPLDFGAGAVNVEDPELIKKITRREAIKEFSSEYDKLDKEIKERFREVPAAICGDFSITGKAGVRKYAAKEAYEAKTWTTKIERLITGNQTGEI